MQLAEEYGNCNHFVMYATPTGQDNVYFELQYNTKTNVDEVYEDVGGEAATNVRVQTVSHENNNREANNRIQASPGVGNVVRRDIVKVRQMQLFVVVAVVVIFLIAAAALSFVMMMTFSKNTPTAPKHDTTVQGK